MDTEFIERGPDYPLKLISIGLVSDTAGNSLYQVSSDFDEAECGEWLRDNVLPNVGPGARIPNRGIARHIREWISEEGGEPEFWGFYADYDWVVFAQLFGTMMDLPKGWPMYCRDIKQMCDSLGNPRLPEQSTVEHNALWDALWNRDAYHWLIDYRDSLVFGE
jgi:hypothetical protein